MALADSWHVRSRGRECTATQRPFADGDTIVTALFPDPESSGYVRRDFSEDGWKEELGKGETPFSFWKTKYLAPTGNETANPVEKLSAEEIFSRLIEEDEDHTENTRYILAVMLERQKLLRETDSQRTPTGILRVYEHRKTGEVYIVKDPDIPLADVERVQQEVFVLLENNGRLPGSAPEESGEITSGDSSPGPEQPDEEIQIPGPVPETVPTEENPAGTGEEEAEDKPGNP